jgi:hypothetical protein
MNSDDPPDKRVMYRERFQGVYLTLMRTENTRFYHVRICRRAYRNALLATPLPFRGRVQAANKKIYGRLNCE